MRLRGSFLRRLFRPADAELADTLLKSARMAQDEGRWQAAADLYARHAEKRPRRAGTWLQLGNMYKELGRFEDAESAYDRSLSLKDTFQVRLQLGYMQLDQGRLDDAAEHLQFALSREVGSVEARHGLIMAGGRDRLPERSPIDGRRVERLERLISVSERLVRQAAEADIVPIKHYGEWRRSRLIADPPVIHASPQSLFVEINAIGCEPYLLRETLTSLSDQTHMLWRAVVSAHEELQRHPVGSFIEQDGRLAWATDDKSREPDVPVLQLPAGVVLDRRALSWLLYGLEVSAADGVYADHDHLKLGGVAGSIYSDPVLHQAPGPIDLTTMPRPPMTILRRSGSPLEMSDLVELAAAQRVAHIPLVLSSLLLDPTKEANVLPETFRYERSADAQALALFEPAQLQGAGSIRIIIPTRDEVAMLKRCIQSLPDNAANPALLQITVVDNRSVQPETQAFLTEGSDRGWFEVMTIDEPFNWSRFNNLAAEASSEPLLLFLNNDTDMVTPGWDAMLRALLFRPDVGVVGARLLYPDGAIQHGGVVIGLGAGAPLHEGVGVIGQEGPERRWVRCREAAAVTGAFLATRRDVFDQVSGFDPGFTIAYNDIDFCLSVRASGRSIIYAGDIVLHHYESRTRGRNNTRSQRAWDLSEQSQFVAKWGSDLNGDPSVNPYWGTGSPRPFDGIVQPSNQRVIEELQRYASANPTRADEEARLPL